PPPPKDNIDETLHALDALNEETSDDVRVLTEKIQGAAKSLSEAESKLVQLKLVLMERQDRVDFLAVKKKACSQQVGILMMKSHSKELGSDVTELQRRAGETERELSIAAVALREQQKKIAESELLYEEALMMKETLSEMLVIMLQTGASKEKAVLRGSLRREASEKAAGF
ncbi:hypothetical protein TeGR_g10694, partial [Tetraparma gracilis]